jgi:hypothetical protein
MSLRDSLNPAVTTAELDASLVVLDLSSNTYFKLNGTGAEIWRKIENGDDEHGIVDGIATDFDRNHDEVAEDVRGFLQELESAGLIMGERG